MGIFGDIAIILIWAIAFDKCAGESDFHTLWEGEQGNREYFLLSDATKSSETNGYWSSKCNEYKSGAYPLLLDNWAEEYPLILSANAPVFYAWIGGSTTNTFHEAVQENEYFTDDSGNFCVVWESDHKILSLGCNKTNGVKGIFCERVTGCENPGTPMNGSKTGNNFNVSETISFGCDDGFFLDGATNITCDTDGKWTDETPTCKEVVCEDPGAPKNGAKLGESYGIGDVVHFTCNEGHEPEGAANMTCSANGTWSEEKPTCPGSFVEKLEMWQLILIIIAVVIILIVLVAVIVHICRTSGSADEKGKLLK